MAIYEMPDGRRVEVADDVVAQLENNNTPTTRKAAVGAGVPRSTISKQVKERADKFEKSASYGDDLKRSIMKGVGFNFMDEIGGAASAATSGIYNAVTKGNISEIGKEYTTARDTQRELDRRAADRSPVTSLVGEIGGAFLNPIGEGAAAITGLSRAARVVGMTRAAAKAERVAAKVASSGPVLKATLAGTNQGALNAVGAAQELSDVPGAALEGGAMGGTLGGILGGGVNAARGVVRTFQKARPENIENLANERVGYLLDKAGITPEEAAIKIRSGNSQGGEVKVGDLSPGLARQEAAISRNPDVASSNDLIALARNRMQNRNSRFSEQVRDTAGTPNGGTDALERLDNIEATRKGAGSTDYAKGGAMDAPVNRSPELDDFFANAPKETNQALRNAYDDMLLRRENPVGVIETHPETGVVTAIPNMRALDYVKRGFDTSIGQAIKSGNKAQAQGLSSERQRLMEILGDANPQYKEILATQRDLFQKQRAVEIGDSFLKAMVSEPRKFLKNTIKKLQPNEIDDARVGIVDALINMESKGNPVQAFQNMTRTPAQREVLEFAFGGRAKFNNFQRWVNRELRSASTDKMIAPGGQSITSDMRMAAESGNEVTKSTMRDVLFRAFKGFGFGGSIGGVSGAMQGLAMGLKNTSHLAQEDIARILMSDGAGLSAGIAKARATQAAEKLADQNTARAVGKGVQQPFTSLIGN